MNYLRSHYTMSRVSEKLSNFSGFQYSSSGSYVWGFLKMIFLIFRAKKNNFFGTKILKIVHFDKLYISTLAELFSAYVLQPWPNRIGTILWGLNKCALIGSQRKVLRHRANDKTSAWRRKGARLTQATLFLLPIGFWESCQWVLYNNENDGPF